MSNKTIHIINEILSWIVTGGIVLAIIVITTLIIYKAFELQEKEKVKYRAELIQEFCERSDYDFCEIEKIIYKERVDVDNQEEI